MKTFKIIFAIIVLSASSHSVSAIGYPVNLVGKRTNLSKETKKIENSVKQTLSAKTSAVMQSGRNSTVKAVAKFLFQ